MRMSWHQLGFVAATLTLALPLWAQSQETRREQAQAARELRGRIVRTGQDQFVVQTRDNKQVTFYTNPQTRYLSNNRAAAFTDLRQGAEITAAYTMDGDRYLANNVTLIPANAQPETAPAQPATQPPQAAATNVEGQVVRVVGSDQVVVKTNDGKEVTVYVTPQTTYTMNNQPWRFTELQPGVPINVYYDVRDRRNIASRVLGLPRKNR
jgi:hypothetical protein